MKLRKLRKRKHLRLIRSDPYWRNVTLLLHSDGTRSSAFLDPPIGKYWRSYPAPTSNEPGIVVTGKGNYAKYTANFTPPTEPFPESGS